MASIIKVYNSVVEILEKIFLPISVLFLRIWMAQIFWYSGLTKISDWQATIALFREEYKVPILSPELAASISTFFELTCPILLVLGLATRFATLPMFGMTFVIWLTYPDVIEHYYWAMLLLIILCYGSGALSLDYMIKKRYT